MVRTRRGLGNDNLNCHPEPRYVIEHAPRVVQTSKPVAMVGIQAMIQAMIVEQVKEADVTLVN